MGIFDRFKQKKKPSFARHGQAMEGKQVDKKPAKVKIEKKTATVQRAMADKSDEIYSILKYLRITEQASDLAKQNKYVFEVHKNTNKIQIKHAIEKLYNVQVGKINIINIPKKKRRLRGIQGWKKGKRKAIVTLSKGKIEIG